MQPRKLRSKWKLLGGLKAGAEKSTGEKTEKNCEEKKSEESSSDEESSSSVGEIHTDDDSEGLHYGSEDSDLSNWLDEELQKAEADVLEEKELSLPAQGWTSCLDEIDAVGPNHEEGEGQPITPAQAEQQVVRCEEDMDLGEVLGGGEEGKGEEDELSIVKKKMPKTVDMMLKMMNVVDDVAEDDKDDEDERCDDGFKFLQQLDRDFLCSPRMIVRGVYTGEVLKLVVRRKTEGNLVHWALFDMKRNKQLLSVKAQMEYQYKISSKALGTSEGVEVLGGWNWRGWGYGYFNLFPSSDSRVLHIDVQEAIFYDNEVNVHYHVSGSNCKNAEKAEGVLCKEDGCGLRIHSVNFTSFETAEEKREYYEPRRERKEKEVQYIYLSLVAFYSGQYKICLHRDWRLKKYHEEVAWLTKDESARFDESVAGVDQLKIEKAQLIWETSVPKRRAEGETLAAQVNIL